jgi:manganese/zinc/iron transport system permease protein
VNILSNAFSIFNQPNVAWVLSGSLILGFVTAILGTFAYLQKRSLVGDALAHAALPGTTTAFILFQSRSPLVILFGAILSCLIGYFGIEYLVKYTKIKEDSALAIILSFFFGIGLFHLSFIQKMPQAQQSGLDKILFGQAASLVRDDVTLLLWIGVVILIFISIFFHIYKYILFDPVYARCLGIRVTLFEFLLAFSIVLSVAIGLQLVGVVLMAALLLTPASSARYWSNNFKYVVLLAGFFGAFSGAVGSLISYILPAMPTGPWIVIISTIFFILSLLFAPQRGMLAKAMTRKRLLQKIDNENLLRGMYKLTEKQDVTLQYVPELSIYHHLKMNIRQFYRAVKSLEKQGMLHLHSGQAALTMSGYERAKELTRYHRLWEVYLERYLGLKADHLHDDAEIIEHLMTKDIEVKLMEILDAPSKDPHGMEIP